MLTYFVLFEVRTGFKNYYLDLLRFQSVKVVYRLINNKVVKMFLLQSVKIIFLTLFIVYISMDEVQNATFIDYKVPS